jgi:hypothetical protein
MFCILMYIKEYHILYMYRTVHCIIGNGEEINSALNFFYNHALDYWLLPGVLFDHWFCYRYERMREVIQCTKFIFVVCPKLIVLPQLALPQCRNTVHCILLKLPSPTKLARLGHFPPASQTVRLAGPGVLHYIFSLAINSVDSVQCTP